MSRTRPPRRAILAGASALGSLSVLGCIGIGGDDGADAEDTDRSERDADDRSLRSEAPIELVEPDATIDSGFAPSNRRITNIHGHGDYSHWHFEPLQVRHGDERTVKVRYLDKNLEALPLGANEPFRTTVDVVDPSPAGFLATSVDGDLVALSGEAIGGGDLRFGLWRDDELAWEAPLLAVEVTDAE